VREDGAARAAPSTPITRTSVAGRAVRIVRAVEQQLRQLRLEGGIPVGSGGASAWGDRGLNSQHDAVDTGIAANCDQVEVLARPERPGNEQQQPERGHSGERSVPGTARIPAQLEQRMERRARTSAPLLRLARG